MSEPTAAASRGDTDPSDGAVGPEEVDDRDLDEGRAARSPLVDVAALAAGAALVAVWRRRR